MEDLRGSGFLLLKSNKEYDLLSYFSFQILVSLTILGKHLF
jgi:hypothetical protein